MRKKIRKIFGYAPTFMKSGIIRAVPSLFSILEINPTSCNIMVTARCNLKCLMCKQWREPAREELSTESWKRVIDDLKDNGIKSVHFTGGEPLLRNDLAELVSYASRNGFAVGMTTNGTLLTGDRLDALLTAGLRSIAVSIDAVDLEYDRIRGVTAVFSKVSEAARLIAGAKKSGKVNAYINFTLMRGNFREFKKVKAFADKLNLAIHICLIDKNSSIFNLPKSGDENWMNTAEDLSNLKEFVNILKKEKIKDPGSLILNFPGLKYINDYFADPVQKTIPCVSSQDRVIIDQCGNFLGGCLSKGSFGNVTEKKIGQIRRDPAYKKAKRDMFYKRCKGCSCGYLFNISLSPELVAEDFFKRAACLVFGSRDA